MATRSDDAVTTAVDTPQRRKRRLPVLAAAFVAVALLLGVFSVTADSKRADAWSWDPHVTLQGKATCSVLPGGTLNGMYIRGSNGEAGWARLGSGTVSKPYSFDFWRVPTYTMTVWVTVYCSYGSYSTSFGLNRPAWGTAAGRNICPFSGCYFL